MGWKVLGDYGAGLRERSRGRYAAVGEDVRCGVCGVACVVIGIHLEVDDGGCRESGIWSRVWTWTAGMSVQAQTMLCSPELVQHCAYSPPDEIVDSETERPASSEIPLFARNPLSLMSAHGTCLTRSNVCTGSAHFFGAVAR